MNQWSKVLPKTFYRQKTEKIACQLLGKYLIRRIGPNELVGKIVETEAYIGPHDLASHSRFGITSRNRVMFGPAGHAYIYLVYGMYYCLNVVTEDVDFGAAVLIRALEPISNIKLKTSGPGLVCKALDITRSLNGADLTKSRVLFLAYPRKDAGLKVVSSARIGVGYAGKWKNRLLRFYIDNNEFVSHR